MVEKLVDRDDVRVSRISDGAQWLLHAEPADAPQIEQATKLQLPTTMLNTGVANGWSVLHMAPDEWMLLGAEDQSEGLEAQFRNSALPAHSLVEISDRSFWLRIDGERAGRLLAGACPIDIDQMPAGTATRTLFGKATIVLWKNCGDFRISHARSYDAYVVALIIAIADDMAGEKLSA